MSAGGLKFVYFWIFSTRIQRTSSQIKKELWILFPIDQLDATQGEVGLAQMWCCIEQMWYCIE